MPPACVQSITFGVPDENCRALILKQYAQQLSQQVRAAVHRGPFAAAVHRGPFAACTVDLLLRRVLQDMVFLAPALAHATPWLCWLGRWVVPDPMTHGL